MVLATAGEGSGLLRVFLLCAVLGGLAYGVYQILSIGRRESKLPLGKFAVVIVDRFRETFLLI